MTEHLITLDIKTPDAFKPFFGETIPMDVSYTQLERMIYGTSAASKEFQIHIGDLALHIISQPPFHIKQPSPQSRRPYISLYDDNVIILEKAETDFYIELSPKHLDPSHTRILETHNTRQLALKMLYYTSILKKNDSITIVENTLPLDLIHEMNDNMIKAATKKAASILLPDSPERDMIISDLEHSCKLVTERRNISHITHPAIKEYLEYKLPPLLASLFPKTYTFKFPTQPFDIKNTLGDEESAYKNEITIMHRIIKQSPSLDKFNPFSKGFHIDVTPNDLHFNINLSDLHAHCENNATAEPYLKLLTLLLFKDSTKRLFLTGTVDLNDIDPSLFIREMEIVQNELHTLTKRYSKIITLQLFYSRMLRIKVKPTHIKKHLSDIERLLLDCPDDNTF